MSRLTWIVAVALTGFAVCADAQVSGVQGSDVQARLAALEEEVALLRSQPAAGDSCAPDWCQPCGGPVWDAGAELTLLRLYSNSIVLDDILEDELEITPDYDLEAGIRAWLGQEYASGLGWRVSGWTFDDHASVDFLGLAELNSEIDLYTVDFEILRRGRFCGWDLLASGGVRIAGIQREYSIGTDDLLLWFNDDFDGAGLTLALGAEQGLGCSNFSVYADFRGSIVFGDTDFEIGIGDMGDVIGVIDDLEAIHGSVNDRAVLIWQMRLGVEYERTLRVGTLFGRAGVEAQAWQLPPAALGLLDDTIGLFGPTFALGVRL